MNGIRFIAGVLAFWSSTVWGATLTWNANNEPDLAGYRIYQCSQQPCTQSSGNASLLVTLGTTTSFNIGTPAIIQYYFITAYDHANNESDVSNLTIFTPIGSPPPVVPPPVTPPPVVPPPITPPPVSPPVIGANPTTLSFVATQGGADPAPQTVSINNQGGGTLNWTTSDNVSWLRRSTSSGTGNGTMILSITTGTLLAGSYSATVTINATGASSVTVPVAFTVTSTPPPPPPPPPAAPPTPSGLRISAVQ